MLAPSVHSRPISYTHAPTCSKLNSRFAKLEPQNLKRQTMWQFVRTAEPDRLTGIPSGRAEHQRKNRREIVIQSLRDLNNLVQCSVALCFSDAAHHRTIAHAIERPANAEDFSESVAMSDMWRIRYSPSKNGTILGYILILAHDHDLTLVLTRSWETWRGRSHWLRTLEPWHRRVLTETVSRGFTRFSLFRGRCLLSMLNTRSEFCLFGLAAHTLRMAMNPKPCLQDHQGKVTTTPITSTARLFALACSWISGNVHFIFMPSW
ncbi:hypothetical protein F5I97DRAFT_1507865 [Phlebopus sp. FC_14]|nr:hypothetical protein F5I97DRAFT_1507865 [Phlebopus sp. FC_14]